MQFLKQTLILGLGMTMLNAVIPGSVAQNVPATKPAELAPPTNVRVEAGEHAMKVRWDASPDEANYELAGYNVYFATESLALLWPGQLPHAVELGRRERACVVRGLENGRQYFFHVRSRSIDGGISTASLPEQEAAPQSEGKNYAVAMYDDDVARSTNNSGYGWHRENGQDIAGHRTVTQHGQYVDILMMASPTAQGQSVFISPSEADFNQRWPYRNRTLIADIGTDWVIADSLVEVAFATTADIKNGHVYVLKTHDNYYVKLRVNSIAEVSLLSPFGVQSRDTSLNKITFTYASQLDQSYEHFLTGKP
ncbi:MAG: fibronectin type III domain-containing protein [bacterium]